MNLKTITSKYKIAIIALQKTIKGKTIKWLSHIKRMESDRRVKRIFEDKPGGKTSGSGMMKIEMTEWC
jgi:hypothetical protein